MTIISNICPFSNYLGNPEHLCEIQFALDKTALFSVMWDALSSAKRLFVFKT